MLDNVMCSECGGLISGPFNASLTTWGICAMCNAFEARRLATLPRYMPDNGDVSVSSSDIRSNA